MNTAIHTRRGNISKTSGVLKLTAVVKFPLRLDYGICKPEASNIVKAPDDDWCAARNMLSLQ
jgi:hypothetical protein